MYLLYFLFKGAWNYPDCKYHKLTNSLLIFPQFFTNINNGITDIPLSIYL